MNKDWHDGRFHRYFTAAVTPFKEGGYDIDEEGLRKLLRYFTQPQYVEAGMGIIINPEAGELFYMSREEKRRAVQIAVEEVGGKVPLFAGAIDLRAEDTVQVAKDAKEEGVDGIFLMPPIGTADLTTSWNAEKYPEVWVELAKAIDTEVNLPMIAHPVANFNANYGIGVPLPTVKKMCEEIPNIVGWKMIYTWEAWKRVAKYLRSLENNVAVLASSARAFHEGLASDLMDGTVSGSFNYALEPMMEHIKAFQEHDFYRAKAIWQAGLSDLHAYVYEEHARLHTRYKTAVWIRGLISHPFMRPPMTKPKKIEAITLRNLLHAAGLSVIGQAEFDEVLAKLLD